MLGTPAPTWVKIAAWIAVIASIAMTVRGVLRASALQTVLWTFASIGLVLVGVVLFLHRGFLIWDPSVYYFSRIPSEIDAITAATTVIGGIIFSVIGASIPAARAQRRVRIEDGRVE